MHPKVQLILQFDSHEDLFEFCASRAVATSGVQTSAPKSKFTPVPVGEFVEQTKAAKATKPTAKKAAPVEKPVEEDLVEDEDDDVEEEGEPAIVLDTEPTFENVKAAATTMVSVTKSRDNLVKILKRFGAAKVGPDIKEDDYEDFIEACQQLIDKAA